MSPYPTNKKSRADRCQAILEYSTLVSIAIHYSRSICAENHLHAELIGERDGRRNPTSATWADQYSKHQFQDNRGRSNDLRRSSEQRREYSNEANDKKSMNFAQDRSFRSIPATSNFKSSSTGVLVELCSSDVHWMTSLLKPRLPPSMEFGNVKLSK